MEALLRLDNSPVYTSSLRMPFGDEIPIGLVLPYCRREEISKDVVNVVILIDDDVSHIQHLNVERIGSVDLCWLANSSKNLPLSAINGDQVLFGEAADKNSPVA